MSIPTEVLLLDPFLLIEEVDVMGRATCYHLVLVLLVSMRAVDKIVHIKTTGRGGGIVVMSDGELLQFFGIVITRPFSPLR